MPQEIAMALASRSNGIKFWDVNNNVATQDIASATYQVDVPTAQVTPKEKRKRQETHQQPTTMEVSDLSSVSHGGHGHSEQPVLDDVQQTEDDHAEQQHMEEDQSVPKRAMQRGLNKPSQDDDHTTDMVFKAPPEITLSEGIALLNTESHDIAKLTSALEKSYNVICYLYKRNEHSQNIAKTKVAN